MVSLRAQNLTHRGMHGWLAKTWMARTWMARTVAVMQSGQLLSVSDTTAESPWLWSSHSL